MQSVVLEMSSGPLNRVSKTLLGLYNNCDLLLARQSASELSHDSVVDECCICFSPINSSFVSLM